MNSNSNTQPIENESFPAFIGRMIGIVILLPFAFLAFLTSWTTISIIGVIIFVGFPVSAIF